MIVKVKPKDVVLEAKKIDKIGSLDFEWELINPRTGKVFYFTDEEFKEKFEVIEND